MQLIAFIESKFKQPKMNNEEKKTILLFLNNFKYLVLKKKLNKNGISKWKSLF